MARIGKIARLPLETREKLNRRLADGEAGVSLLRWLNGLPATREVLEELFGGAAITKQNLSEWRKGGFREWQTRQELLSDPRKTAARAQEVREAAGDKLTDDLATVLAGHYAVVLKRWLAQPTRELEARLRVLHGLCVDIVALRRGDHAVARLKFDMERWEFESSLVQAKKFHRGGAETQRKCGVGDGDREREEVTGDGGPGESKLVQVKIISGALESGVRTTVEAGEYSRSAGLLSNICMFSKAGVTFSVSPGMGWSVGTVARRTVEGVVEHTGREAVKTAELQARDPLTWLKPGVDAQREDFSLPQKPGDISGDRDGRAPQVYALATQTRLPRTMAIFMPTRRSRSDQHLSQVIENKGDITLYDCILHEARGELMECSRTKSVAITTKKCWPPPTLSTIV